MLNHRSAPVQIGATVLVIPFIATIYGLEQLIMSPARLIIVIVGLLFFFYRKAKTTATKAS
jgi:hypothetical protein